MPFAWILLGMIVVLCIQAIMLTAVLRCRQFLSLKQEHEMALKIAEKSVSLVAFINWHYFN
jgi:hypothetical protein